MDAFSRLCRDGARCPTQLESLMSAKTICCSFLTGALLAFLAPAQAGVPDDVRKDFAQAVYTGSPDLVHNGNPQPLLRAVIVLNVKLDDGGHWQHEVVRTNSEQPEMLARAIETVHRAPPIAVNDDVRGELRRNGFMEAWLFDNDGRFQVKTLAKAQRMGQ
jgi:periplasmic protein TonB